MQTSDAIEKKDGQFTMTLGGDNPRINAVKLALGSVEFPMVQWTIEEDWNLLYLSEGYRIYPSNSWLRIEEKSDTESNNIQIQLPLYLNEIEKIRSQGGNYFSVKTKHPHGLWIDGRRSVIPAITWGSVDILCSDLGRVNLTNLHNSRDLEYLSEFEFMIHFSYNVDPCETSHGYVHVPTIPCPELLCETLSFLLTYSKSIGSYVMEFNATKNQAQLMSTCFPPKSSSLHVKLIGSELVRMLGYNSDYHFQRFIRKTSAQNVLDATQVFVGSDIGQDPPLRIPSEILPTWTCVNLQPGWYAPAHRPMCTGAPLRMTQEFENSMNRLMFPIPERIPKGHGTSHFVVFSDPSGVQHMVPIYAGKYDAISICAHLEKEMSRLASLTIENTTISVHYDITTHKFTFSCEIRNKHNIVTAAPFVLMFQHSASIDGSKFGFANISLQGSDTYTSSYEVYLPYMRWNNTYATNVYKISEIAYQKRFMIESLPNPSITCLILDYDDVKSELVLQTSVGQLPYAHGLNEYDLVSISPASQNSMYKYDKNEEEWVLTDHVASPIAPSVGKSGVVIDSNESPIQLRLKVKPSQSLCTCVGQVISIQQEVNPFNMCFGVLPRSVPANILGFNEGAIQWGFDGSVFVNTVAKQLKLPPFQAIGVHNLDHPDYILLYILEGKTNVNLQHTYKNNSTSPFAKLVLYPMFREERMLPRDTTLLGSEMLSTFTIKFTNPNGLPYHFHDAQFSFSLNFIRVSDS